MDRKPKFGEWLRNTVASPSNPHRDGIFVREYQRTGRMNPGTWWEMTDGNGKFWSVPPGSIVPVPHNGEVSDG